MSDTLNHRVADALRSMPMHNEFAFSVVAGNMIDPVLFATRFQTLPDGEPQVYALDAPRLECFKAYEITSTFTYTLCVSPMAPMQVYAVVLNTKGSDPLVPLHAPEFASVAQQRSVIHFVDEAAMRAFVSNA